MEPLPRTACIGSLEEQVVYSSTIHFCQVYKFSSLAASVSFPTARAVVLIVSRQRAFSVLIVSFTANTLLNSSSSPNMSAQELPSPPACMAFNRGIPNAYGYHPSLAPGIVFTVLFATSAFIHLYQCLRQTIQNRRLWWLWLFFVGATFETLGWIARTAANPCPYSIALFKMQLAVLISGKFRPFLHTPSVLN